MWLMFKRLRDYGEYQYNIWQHGPNIDTQVNIKMMKKLQQSWISYRIKGNA